MDYENFYYKEALEGAKKKYNEALERAKKLQETCDNPSVVGWCEYIFPQLRESEDEKIRKGLIEFFRDWGKTRSYCWNIYIPDILTWLEKQGEQKPANKPQRIVSAEVKEAMYDKPAEWSEDDENMLNLILGLLSYHRQCRNWLKSLKGRVQPQQQEWSEEDEMIALSIEQVMNCASLLNIVPEKIDKIRTWLKSLKDRMKGE